jgi:hypothetical protein
MQEPRSLISFSAATASASSAGAWTQPRRTAGTGGDRGGPRAAVRLHGLAAYCGDPATAAPPALVMGLGNVRERAIEPAVAAVASLLK